MRSSKSYVVSADGNEAAGGRRLDGESKEKGTARPAPHQNMFPTTRRGRHFAAFFLTAVLYYVRILTTLVVISEAAEAQEGSDLRE